MIRLFVRHNVADYAQWRKAYDAFDATRRTMGVKGDAVYRAVDDPNDVTAWHDFVTRQEADAFASSATLHDVMQKAGVKGKPNIWLVNPA